MLVTRSCYERELSSALLYPPDRAMANEGGGEEKESGGGGPAVVIDEEPFGRSVDAPCRLGRHTRSLGEGRRSLAVLRAAGAASRSPLPLTRREPEEGGRCPSLLLCGCPPNHQNT